jgi:hypothetical protein
MPDEPKENLELVKELQRLADNGCPNVEGPVVCHEGPKLDTEVDVKKLLLFIFEHGERGLWLRQGVLSSAGCGGTPETCCSKQIAIDHLRPEAGTS